jgi:hypothetical protein
MNLSKVKRGMRVVLDSGAIAEVLAIPRGGQTARVRYVDTMGEPQMVGAEGEVAADEVIAMTWGRISSGPPRSGG